MATILKLDAIRPLKVKDSRVGVTFNGRDWKDVYGSATVTHTAGSASVEQTQTFTAVGAVTGAATIETVSLELAAHQPQMQVLHDLQRANKRKSPVTVRWDIYSDPLLEAASAAASGGIEIPAASLETADPLTTGNPAKGSQVSFSGTDAGYTAAAVNANFAAKTWMVGDVLLSGSAGILGESGVGTAYIVNAVEEDDETGAIGNIFVKEWKAGAPAAADAVATAAAYSVRTAGARWQFSATVSMFGSFAGDAGGDPAVSSSINFQPVAEVALPSLLVVNQAGAGW